MRPMKAVRLLWIAVWIAGCTPGPGPAFLTPGPTATLRGLPSATASPVFPTALASDTPAPSPTPLPTATPMVHVIQSGDTLIAIAVRYNVSLEALEAANPGLNPQNLQLGQPIIVPAPEAVPGETGGIVPTALPIQAGSFTCAPSPVGSLLCLGEVVNSLDQPITNLSVRVTLLNPDESAGGSAVTYAPLDWIPPGASVPMGVVFASGSQQAALAQVMTADSGLGLAERFSMLAVSEVAGAATTAGFTLSGSLTNTAPIEMPTVIVVGTVYNSALAVTAYRRVVIEQPLGPGASLSFTLTLPGVSSAARWAVLAQGRTQ
jgi:LysM repeat protein